MKWAKCISQKTRPLTVGKIYGVKQTRVDNFYFGSKTKLTINEILIKGDDDKERWYHLERFEDATAEVREQLINEILNE